MSSTTTGTPTPGTSTTDASPSSSSSLPPNSSGQLSNGTNYFFGFLIAFIAFLFVFLSLGLLARRRRMRLMADFLLYGPDSDDSHLPNITQTEPSMWQPTYEEAKGKQWSAIMPLSTSLVWRDVVDEKAAEEMPHAPRRRNPFVPYLGLSPPRTLPPTIKVPEAMDIAVMINMPQAPEALEEDGILEYQIGMLQVPWKDESLLLQPT